MELILSSFGPISAIAVCIGTYFVMRYTVSRNDERSRENTKRIVELEKNIAVQKVENTSMKQTQERFTDALNKFNETMSEFRETVADLRADIKHRQ